MKRDRSMPGVFGPGYASLPSDQPSSSSPKHLLQDWLQRWLQEWLLQSVASQLKAVKIPSIKWMGANIHPSINSPLMPVGLGFALFAIPLVISLIVYAIQLTMLGIAATHFGPLVLDGVLSLKQQKNSAKSTMTAATSRTVLAGIAGVLAVGYSIGTIASLVVLASSAYGCVGRENQKGSRSQKEVAAQAMPAKTVQCPFRRTARHCKSVVRLVSERR